MIHDSRLCFLSPDGGELTPGTVAALLALLVGSVILLARWVVFSLLRESQLQLPRLHMRKGWDYATLLKEGAKRYPNSPYIIKYNGYEYVVFPSSSFGEVKRLGTSRASMVDWFNQILWQGWPFMGTDNHSRYHSIAIDLTRALPSRVWARQNSAKSAFEAVLGGGGTRNDWTAVRLWETVHKIVSLMNGISLLGPELGTDPRWLKATQRLQLALMIGIVGSSLTPRIFRPLMAPIVFLPAKLVDWHMKALLRPKLERELNTYEEKESARGFGSSNEADISPASLPVHDGSRNGTNGSRDIDESFALTEWLLTHYRPKDDRLNRLLRDYIVIAFEAAVSSSSRVYFMLIELATRPELVEELREEVVQNSDKFGRLPASYLVELCKMDSFMLESARLAASRHLTLFRRVQKPLKLSIGPELPPGTLICVDKYHMDQPQNDVLDPLRSYKMRQQPGHEDMHQFTVPGPENTIWGGGPQACPGRLFASVTIKVVLAHFLTHYDIKLLPGDAGKPMSKHMPNGSISPDFKAQIMIRHRRAS